MDNEIVGSSRGLRHIRRQIWSGNLNERRQLEELGLDIRTILKWILKKYDFEIVDCFMFFGIGTNE